MIENINLEQLKDKGFLTIKNFLNKEEIEKITNQLKDVPLENIGHGDQRGYFPVTPKAKLIKLLKPKGKFLFISSSEIYSGIKDKIISENFSGVTTPEHIRACYIESKRCGETIVNEFRKERIKAVSARLCLAYGPGFKINDERVLSQFIKRAFK